MSSVALVIPARLGSTRLPRKVLLPWEGEPIIAHVAKRALKSDRGPVYVACDSPDVEEALKHLPVTCIQTDPALYKGTDRVQAAMNQLKPHISYDIIVNIQGDLPNVTASMINGAIQAANLGDIGTVASPITDSYDITSPSVVKIALSSSGRALYFSRAPIPHNALQYYHHIGIYAYHREILDRYVTLEPTLLENQENLEQLRAMESGMSIYVSHVDETPISIDTQADYEKLLTMKSSF